MTTEVLFSTRKAPIGCKRDAIAAARKELDEIGSGLFKRVYISPDGKVVYKVARGATRNGDRRVDRGRERCIVAEVAWAAEGRKRHTPGIPNVTLWSVNGEPVEAMLFVTFHADQVSTYSMTYGQRTRHWDRINRYKGMWLDLGLEDLHSHNYRFDARHRPVVVDLGGWSDTAPFDTLPKDIRDLTTDIYSIDEQCDEYCECDDCMGFSQCDGCGWNRDECECDPCADHSPCADCYFCLDCGECECDKSTPAAPNPNPVMPAWVQMFDGVRGDAICVLCDKQRGAHFNAHCDMPLAQWHWPTGAPVFADRLPTCVTRMDEEHYHFSHKGRCDDVFSGWCRLCNPFRYREAKAAA